MSGDPEEEYISRAMDKIQFYLEKNNDSQVSVEELLELMPEEKLTERTIVWRLNETYGDRQNTGHPLKDT